MFSRPSARLRPARLTVRAILFAAILAGSHPDGAAAQAFVADVLSYDLALDLGLEYEGLYTSRNSLTGTARITFRHAGAEPVSRVPILLHRLMRVEAARSQDGRALDIEHRVTSLDGWETYQAQATTVALPDPLLPGDTMTLDLEYGGSLHGYTETGMLYVQEALDPAFTIIRPESSSYPRLVGPTRDAWRTSLRTDAFDLTVAVTVPEGSVVASGHELLGKVAREGRVTWTYRSQEPVNAIMLPVAPFGVIEVGPHRVYHLPEDAEGARRVATGITKTMALFSEWFGPLQDSSAFAVVEIPEMHGSQAIRPTIIQEATAFRSASGMKELYHEISHLWNVSDPAVNQSRWNEGLATFLQEVVAERFDGDPGRLDRELEKHRARLMKHLGDRPEHRGIPLLEAGDRGVTSVFSYSGGGLFFGLLDRRLGRGPLLAVLRDFYQEHHAAGATSDAFATFLAERAPEARTLVDEWLRSGTYSELLLEGLDFEALVRRYAD
jgi:aminopeptidase N